MSDNHQQLDEREPSLWLMNRARLQRVRNSVALDDGMIPRGFGRGRKPRRDEDNQETLKKPFFSVSPTSVDDLTKRVANLTVKDVDSKMANEAIAKVTESSVKVDVDAKAIKATEKVKESSVKVEEKLLPASSSSPDEEKKEERRPIRSARRKLSRVETNKPNNPFEIQKPPTSSTISPRENAAVFQEPRGKGLKAAVVKTSSGLLVSTPVMYNAKKFERYGINMDSNSQPSLSTNFGSYTGMRRDSEPYLITFSDTEESSLASLLATKENSESQKIKDSAVEDLKSWIVDAQLSVENALPMEDSNPAVQNEKPVLQIAKPVVENAKPVIENAKPAVENAKPVVENAKPFLEVAKPVVENAKPFLEVAKPVVETMKPVVEIMKPDLENVTPTLENVNPVMYIAKPAVDIAKPVVNIAMPILENVKPMEYLKPMQDNVKPMEYLKPMQDNVKPMEYLKPMQDNVKPMEYLKPMQDNVKPMEDAKVNDREIAQQSEQFHLDLSLDDIKELECILGITPPTSSETELARFGFGLPAKPKPYRFRKEDIRVYMTHQRSIRRKLKDWVMVFQYMRKDMSITEQDLVREIGRVQAILKLQENRKT